MDRWAKLLGEARQALGGEDSTWDKWADEWLAGDVKGERAIAAHVRGFEEGLAHGLGITDGVLVNSHLGDLDARYVRARARAEVTWSVLKRGTKLADAFFERGTSYLAVGRKSKLRRSR